MNNQYRLQLLKSVVFEDSAVWPGDDPIQFRPCSLEEILTLITIRFN